MRMQINRRKIAIGIVIAAVLALLFVLCGVFDRYEPEEDEIAIHIRFDTKEDVGLLIFDYSADGHEYTGGTSNADRSMIKHDSEDIVVWNKAELEGSSDAVQLSVRFRIITEYVTPNFENVYPEDITKYTEPIAFQARFGEMYSVTITGDKETGYKAVLETTPCRR